jgi:type IV secretion system protein VirD4
MASHLYNLPDPKRRELSRKIVFVGAALLLAHCWALSQLFARELAFHPFLGEPWLASAGSLSLPVLAFLGPLTLLLVYSRRYTSALLTASVCAVVWLLGSQPVYGPLSIVSWLLRFHGSRVLAPLLTSYTTLLLAGCGVFTAVSFVAQAALGPRTPPNADIHGSARWAVQKDVEDAGLLSHPSGPTMAGHNGVFLGLWRKGRRTYPLYLDQDRTVLVFAPPRSGKGVGMVVPTCLGWQGSLVVLDIKGELNHLTAGFRARELGQIYLPFDPTRPDGTGARYNPLAEIRLGDLAVRDAQNVADILVDPDGNKTLSHWDKTAHALLTAVLLHVLHAEPTKTLAGCGSFLSQVGVPIRDVLKKMRDTLHLGETPHPIVAEIAQGMLNKADEELSGIVSTALACLTIYQDPIIARATEESDFSIRDLFDSPIPLSFYLIIPPSDLNRTRPLVRLLLNQLCRRLIERMEFDGGKTRAPNNRVLLLLDEFPALGRLPFLQESLAYLAGYGITCFLVTQDLSQLRGIYGRDESITPNCHYRVAFTPNMPETAQVISSLSGSMTVHHEHLSKRVGAPFGGAQATRSQQETRRPLLTPDEALRLPATDQIIFPIGAPPILAKRFKYYEDPEFLRRSLVAPPERADRIPRPNPWAGRLIATTPPPTVSRLPRRRSAP